MKNIELEIVGDNTQALELTGDFFPNVKEGKKEHKVEIKCNKEFNELCALEVYRYSKWDSAGVLCGKLWILPNSAKYQKVIKIAFVQVLTNLNYEIACIDYLDLKQIIADMNKYFKQAFIQFEFDILENVSLMEKNDLGVLKNYRTILNDRDREELKLKKAGAILATKDKDRMIRAIHKLVKSKLTKDESSYYKDDLKIFLVNEWACEIPQSQNYPSIQMEIAGAFPPNHEMHAMCFRRGLTPETISHELFHLLGLADVFKEDKMREGYAFKQGHSSNLMDYSDTRLGTYYAQWRKMNNKIKKIK